MPAWHWERILVNNGGLEIIWSDRTLAPGVIDTGKVAWAWVGWYVTSRSMENAGTG